MKYFTIFLAAILISSCSMKIVPLKGNYNTPTEYYSDRSVDEVWESIIDLFAKNGLPIKIIDKNSGLIAAGREYSKATTEDNNGNLVDTNALFVSAKMINPANYRVIDNIYVTSDWNIRIKKTEKGTYIGVNLFINRVEYLDQMSPIYHPYKGLAKSTGKLERMVAELVR